MRNLLFSCLCESHGIVIKKWYDVPNIVIELWYSGMFQANFRRRLEAALNILRYGTCFQEEVILTYDDTEKLIEELRRVLNESKHECDEATGSKVSN